MTNSSWYKAKRGCLHCFVELGCSEPQLVVRCAHPSTHVTMSRSLNASPYSAAYPFLQLMFPSSSVALCRRVGGNNSQSPYCPTARVHKALVAQQPGPSQSLCCPTARLSQSLCCPTARLSQSPCCPTARLSPRWPGM